MNNNPIGILDSGLGGLTVWKEVHTLLPAESFVYIADSKNTPYGEKSPDEIFALAKKSIDFLLTQQVKMIVTACNAITVSCVDQLRTTYPDLPIVGTVPAIKPAAEQTKNKRIGVLATTRTAESEYQTQLIQQFASDCQVFSHGTDELVPLIETGELRSEAMTQALKKVLADFQKEQIDTLVLGCTHYPFLREQIQAILGENVAIIDSGEAIARRVEWILDDKNMSAATDKNPEYAFYTTGDPVIAKKLFDTTIKEREMPSFQAIEL